MRSVVAYALLVSSTLAADVKVHRDLAYAEPKNERQTLDVHAPATGRDHPIVVWLHGGGWRRGDKTNVQQKPEAMVAKGFVFVSTNYRFVPNVTIPEMAGDVAKAIRWTHDHAREYGGDPRTIFVMGHSAGAHLAALVCTDDRYLKAEGLPLSIVKGCVPVDTAAYDVPRKVAAETSGRPRLAALSPFGDAASQKNVSPLTHVAPGKGIPPFLILHVADRPDSTAQSRRFAEALQAAGVAAKVFAAEGKNHGTINSELGRPGDQPTEAVWEFVSRNAAGKADAAAATDDDKNAAIEKDRRRIRGTWRIVGLTINGSAAKDEDAKKLRVVNGADGAWSLLSEGQEISKGTSSIDPTTNPKTIDFTPTEGAGKDQEFLGIYQLDDDARQLCFAPKEKGRPVEFASPAGSEIILVTFERETAK